MDSIPIVAFTGQVPTHLIGNDAFQEADNVGITRSCTKHNFLVKDGKDLGPIIREAFHIAATGRPGPVHVDLPKDILVKEAELVWPEKVHLRSYNPNYEGHAGQIKKAARLIMHARRPVLYVGGGVISADANEELRELAELTQIPVTTTLMGLGAFPSEHPLSLDMLGMHGAYYANMAVHKSDVLVAVGARFDDRVTGKVEAFAPDAEIVHIDIDPSSISKNIKVDVPIVGDCRRVLRALVEAVREEMKTGGDGRDARRPWHAQIAEWKATQPLRYEWSDEVIKPQYVIQEISNATRGDGMVRQWQRIIYKERYCAIDLPGIPDWVKLAEAYGCVGLRVTKPSEVVPAIEKMLSTPAPVVLDVCVDKDECVFPMVPAGGANTDMILAPPTREVRDRAEKSQTGF